MKEIITKHNADINVVVRIDNLASCDIDSYAEYADAIYFYRMIFRFNESLSKICFYQKSIISKCSSLGLPVIVAGLFLDTMRTLPNPIRAEISDIYNTILQGIDAILLNLEIVSGIYPFEVIETISKAYISYQTLTFR